MPVVAYLNGRFCLPEEAMIPIDERGHQFGDGVYEVVRVYNGRPFLLEGHLRRLERSLQAVGITNPFKRDEWRSLIVEAIARSEESDSLVYWQVTRGIATRAHAFPSCPPSVSLTVRPFKAKPPEEPTLLCQPDERWANAFVKTINLLPNVIAKANAQQAGAFEALLIRDGVITEGSSSNAWFVKDGRIYTHPANRYILGGITRDFVSGLVSKIGALLSEEPISFRDLPSMDEVFMTSTTLEIQSVKRIYVGTESIDTLASPLSDAPPTTLLHQRGTSTTWWEQKSDTHSPIVTRLREAYADAVERFRSAGNDL